MSEERVILITGSSSGLGACLIRHFSKKGIWCGHQLCD